MRNTVLRVPKTTLSHDDLLEELTEFRKAAILVVMIYYSARYGLKPAKGKGPYGRVQQKPEARFQLFSPSRVTQRVLILPAMMCYNTQEV